LARIVFNEMTRGVEDELTGFGISTYLTDNEYPILVVDCDKGTVGVAEPGNETETRASWTFKQFIQLELPEEDPWAALEPAGNGTDQAGG
jgi:hypothetical protein